MSTYLQFFNCLRGSTCVICTDLTLLRGRTDPGLCNHTNCPGGSTYDAVVPSDPSDPLYTNWTKPSYNPLVTGTGDDPSTAWQTPAGEWRLIGNQGCDGLGAPIYGSMDFVKW